MNSFIRIYIVIVLLINTIGFIWGMDPVAIGIYVAMIFMPVNLLILVIGLIKTIRLQIKKIEINYLLNYSVVILFPIAAQLILFLLIDSFARKGGC